MPATTAEALRRYVTDAEDNGLRRVRDQRGVTRPARQCLSWLTPRAARGTVIATVDQIIHGETEPSVAGRRGDPSLTRG